MTWWHREPGHQHPWCWLIDLANCDNYPRTSRVKIKCWKCIRTAVELGWNSFFKTPICWILQGNRHNISRFPIYVYFAWLANKNKSRLKSSDIKFCLIAIVECLVLLVCSVTLCFWTANMPHCLFQVCQCTHELTVCVLCCFWTIKKKKKKIAMIISDILSSCSTYALAQILTEI